MAELNYRQWFNRSFQQGKYQQLLANLRDRFPGQLDFRVSESPLFLPDYFKERLLASADDLVDQLLRLPEEDLKSAIPHNIQVSPDGSRPNLICIDFGICEGSDGSLVPALIELQGCSSLNYYQYELARAYQSSYDIPPELTPYFGGLDHDSYLERMKSMILGSHQPDRVALVDYKPQSQKTRIDFAATAHHLGIPILCLEDLRTDNQRIIYHQNGSSHQIDRIYNRFIFDEIGRSQNNIEIDLSQAHQVEWVVHPNWFFKISKHTMPRLHNQYAPECYTVSAFPDHCDLADFVLKPLYSFSGQGVNLHPQEEDIQSLANPDEYILQRKATFAPVFQDPQGDFAKAEIRIIYSWLPGEDRPLPTINLVRMTKSAMSNVDHNKADQMWTGGSIAYFCPA
ncbi:MAG: hypothetical protein KTR24_10045 [Saprospiraceae bacterium]|nr:hypothetical protein [Saprospiraceae bacterium]